MKNSQLVSADHWPVLLKEVIQLLDPSPEKKFIDGTLGGGGHTKAILERGSRVLAMDRDPDSIAHARERLKEYLNACPWPDHSIGPGSGSKNAGSLQKDAPGTPPLVIVKSDFAEISRIARENGFGLVNGILFDLGIASFQLANSQRGLSFTRPAPLDMRFDPTTQGVTAADLVNSLSAHELTQLFQEFGQEPWARQLAHAIVRARRPKPITNTSELAALASEVKTGWHRKIHPATLIFQALRMAVNTEIDSLKAALVQAPDLLDVKGVLVVISFHSGEDAVVKRFFNSQNGLTSLFAKPISPAAEEVRFNPRSRSAKLRAAIKN